MKTEFIPYEQSLELKELGFDEECFGFYTHKGELRRYTNFDGELNDFQTLKNSSITMGDNWCAAPTFSQAFRWFREKYVLDSMVQPTYSTKYQFRVFNVEIKCKVQIYGDYMVKEFDTYEEAELACLIKLIEIVKKK